MKSMFYTAAIVASLALTGAAYAQAEVSGAAATVGAQPPSTTAPEAGAQASTSNSANPSVTGKPARKPRKNANATGPAPAGTADMSTTNSVTAP